MGQRHEDHEPPVCLECASTLAVLTPGVKIYPHRPDLHHRAFWRCPCGAYCRCHDGTTRPVGRPAGAATRRARMRLHDVLDPLWQEGSGSRSKRRRAVYQRLARALGIPEQDCHVGLFDAAMCVQAISTLQAEYAT
jgi:hypothetical protein